MQWNISCWLKRSDQLLSIDAAPFDAVRLVDILSFEAAITNG